MGITLARDVLDGCLYRLRKEPDSAEARAGLFQVLAPVLHVYSKPFTLTAEMVLRICAAAQDLLVPELGRIIEGWFLRPKGAESRLLRSIKRAVEHSVVTLSPDPATRITEDDVKLQSLRRAMPAARLRVLVDVLARARQHFDQPHGRRFLRLAERCCYAQVIYGRRPSWSCRATQAHFGARYDIARDIYGQAATWAREVLAERIHEVLA